MTVADVSSVIVGLFLLFVVVSGVFHLVVAVFNPQGLAERFFERVKGTRWCYPKKLKGFRIVLGIIGFAVLVVGIVAAVGLL